jgi:hypothetical protein
LQLSITTPLPLVHDSEPRTIIQRAPMRAEFATKEYVYVMRAKSMMLNSKIKRTLMTIAVSAKLAPRSECLAALTDLPPASSSYP